MSTAPHFDIDLYAFWQDPYPTLKQMRAEAPVAYVPQLGATLLTRREDIFVNEKKIEVFSSVQPEGLMTRLMGQYMMPKDGDAHLRERKAIFSTVSPKTVKTVWKAEFEDFTAALLDDVKPKGAADMVADIAMRISGEALRHITGLKNLSWQDMDRVSQGMIDGCANYAGDGEIEARCHTATGDIDAAIDAMIPALTAAPEHSLLSVQLAAGLPEADIRANIKLAISGGQNEPRDVIAGLTWAMLSHPDQAAALARGDKTWLDAFEEYARWISPIGMSPREVAKPHRLHGIDLAPGDRVFLMFSSANRDEAAFENPDAFDLGQDVGPSIAFGAGPHFCAGAWASRCLIAEVAMPMIFKALPNLRLTGPAPFGGWAFRGPRRVPVAWG